MELLKKLSTFEKVRDETVKPGPTSFAPLLPTLQTWVGMVINDGKPQDREPCEAGLDLDGQQRLSNLRWFYQASCGNEDTKDTAKVEENLKACSLPVTKHVLLDYIRHGKRIDTEQAVAMVLAYLSYSMPGVEKTRDDIVDDFERDTDSVISELLKDDGVKAMFVNTCMWREKKDYNLLDDPRQVSAIAKKNKILQIVGAGKTFAELSSPEFITTLQQLRRRRSKLNNCQHLTMPADLLLNSIDEQNKQWLQDKSYQLGKQQPIFSDNVQIIPKRKFRRIQRLLHSLMPPTDVTSRYVFDVQNLIKKSGATSAPRIAALEMTDDCHALAYSFIAAQRLRQLKVVSDHRWVRFLVKGEGALILQNRPDVLTSFEDILVRHANDLVALTAIKCPRGVRDHFSTKKDIAYRAREICEMMERYVNDFGGGDMKELVFYQYVPGGSGRGPVDYYNALCDELRDCTSRAKALGTDLQIGPVYKFLAKDIMSWNNAWGDDAFAGGKIPGWVEYLARVRAEEIKLG